ncbi:MAG: hypothetical protein JXB50_04035, partial [Spirochaetes bacterium]|nr:hypothetical protein [Spirochaetota bacterium]
IFIITFFYLLIWIPFGIDMTDEGKQMTIAWNIYHGSINHNINLHKAGSWIINGLWLSLAGKPLLIWARLGGVLLMSIMICVSFLILKRYDNSLYTIFITFVSLLFVICENHPETKIDHSNLPVLFALISLYFFLLYAGREMDFKGNIIFNVLSFLFMLFSIFTRTPHLLFLIFPIIFYLISLKIYKLDKSTFFKGVISYYSLPIFLIIISFVYMLLHKGLILKYAVNIGNDFFSFFKSFDKIRKLSFTQLLDQNEVRIISYNYFLIHRYLRDTVYIFGIFIIFFTGLFFIENIYRKFIKKFLTDKYLDLIFNIIIAVLILIFINLKPWMWYMSAFAFVLSYVIIIKIRKIGLKIEFFYLFWGFVLFYISFIGSNNSYRHSFPAGAILILMPIIALINHKRKKELLNKNLSFLNRFTYVFFIVILIFSFGKKIINDNKRDSQPMFTRNSMFMSPELRGIFSAKKRVEAIDELISCFKSVSKEEDKLLCFNSIPMMHYLLNKDYYLNDPWLMNYNLTNTKKELEIKAENNLFPDYIIFSKKSAREDDWPDTKITTDKRDELLYKYIVDYINKNNYNAVFENNAFILYKKF